MKTTELVGLPDPNVRPTLSVWPETAGFLNLSKASVYAGAARGEIPTIRIGKRLLVPTAALRRMLQLDGAGGDPPGVLSATHGPNLRANGERAPQAELGAAGGGNDG